MALGEVEERSLFCDRLLALVVHYGIDHERIDKRNQMQFSRNIAPAALAAFCLALAAAGCGQKDSAATPPPAAASASPNTMSLDQQAAMHGHRPVAKP